MGKDEASPSIERGTAGRPKRRRWGRALLFVVLALVLAIVGPVLVFRFVPPPVTFLMVQRLAEGRGLEKSWRPLSRIAPSLPLAAIAAEDARFCEHGGFDWNAIEAAAERNAKGG